MKIIYKDKTEQTINANYYKEYDDYENFLFLINRKYDSDGDYDKDDDQEVMLVNINEIRSIIL